MATIRYKGTKEGGLPVYFPVGALTRGTIKETKWANPTLEVTDSEAAKLVSMDPHNFEIYHTPKAHTVPPGTTPLAQAEVVFEEKKKPGRKARE